MKARINITIDEEFLPEIKELIKKKKYSNRSHFIDKAIYEQLKREKKDK